MGGPPATRAATTAPDRVRTHLGLVSQEHERRRGAGGRGGQAGGQRGGLALRVARVDDRPRPGRQDERGRHQLRGVAEHQHQVGEPGGGGRVHDVLQHRSPVERQELLGRPHPAPGPGGEDEGDDGSRPEDKLVRR